MKFRKTTKNDIPAIIEMIANDSLGHLREKYMEPLPKEYYKAFEIIDGFIKRHSCFKLNSVFDADAKQYKKIFPVIHSFFFSILQVDPIKE